MNQHTFKQLTALAAFGFAIFYLLWAVLSTFYFLYRNKAF